VNIADQFTRESRNAAFNYIVEGREVLQVCRRHSSDWGRVGRARRGMTELAKHETISATQTEALGAELASGLVPGDVVLIDGELGAGKTTFVRGAARALGVTTPVTSPTFTIGQRYPVAAPSSAGQPTAAPLTFVSHIDLYRLSSLRDEDPDLLADYIGADTITFVEWPDAGVEQISELGRTARHVKLIHAGGDRRVVEIT
jgi:tRNA threonylcarbamoyladenosine biosynthesis protein TsaE